MSYSHSRNLLDLHLYALFQSFALKYLSLTCFNIYVNDQEDFFKNVQYHFNHGI